MKPSTEAVAAAKELHAEQWHGMTYERMVESGAAIIDRHFAAAREDRARLDWLESCRVALNAHCGSSYGWEVIRSHLVNRLMLRTPETDAMAGVDLHDTGPGGVNVRAAIDAARAKTTPKDGGVMESDAAYYARHGAS